MLTTKQAQLAAWRELANEARDRALTESQARREAAPVLPGLDTKASGMAGVLSTWQQPPMPVGNYERIAKEGYGGNEIIYACIEALASSAAEPTIYAYRGKTRIDQHPVLDLLNRPNPFMTGHDYIASLIMYRSIAGNAYTEKVFNNGGSLSELWTIRPDRMMIIDSPTTMVGGYRFRLGQFVHDYPVEEIGHYKTRNPLDHRYGLAPMSVILNRTDTDNFAREFTKSFFFNAGVPQTLLAFKALLEDEERAQIRGRWRQDYNGQAGWHNVMVTESNEVEVHPLGMPMGARGIAYPELDEINEARLAMVFGVPLTIISARLGMTSSSYANRLSDREMFWNETLVPIYKELAASFNQWLTPHYDDIDGIAFDLTTINAFQDETDVLHARWRNNYTMSLAGFRETRRKLGIEDDPEDDDIMVVPANYQLVKFKDFKEAEIPMSDSPTPNQLNPTGPGDRQNGNGADSSPNVRPAMPASNSKFRIS